MLAGPREEVSQYKNSLQRSTVGTILAERAKAGGQRCTRAIPSGFTGFSSSVRTCIADVISNMKMLLHLPCVWNSDHEGTLALVAIEYKPCLKDRLGKLRVWDCE